MNFKKKEKRFVFKESLELLKEGFYIAIEDNPAFAVVVSIFKDNSYNFIIPKVTIDYIDLSLINIITKPYEEIGHKFSLYINQNLYESYKGYLKVNNYKLLYNDLYLFKWIETKFKVEDSNIVEINSKNLSKFIKSADICFPDWKTNIAFTKWCLESPYVKMYGIEEDKKIISFGAYYSRENSDYVLLMNAGTLPEYRRKGLHNKLLKYRINDCLEKKERVCFYVNVEPEGNSNKSYLKEDFEKSCVFKVFSNE